LTVLWFFFSSRRRHTRFSRDWSSDVCSSDLEALAQVKAIALDKTRTITYGNPVVSDVITLNNTSREELLACTAGAEIFSEHPLRSEERRVGKESRTRWSPYQ